MAKRRKPKKQKGSSTSDWKGFLEVIKAIIVLIDEIFRRF